MLGFAALVLAGSLRLITFRLCMAEEVNETGTRLALVLLVVVGAVWLTTWELFFIFIFVWFWWCFFC
jgi:hypothetical protein